MPSKNVIKKYVEDGYYHIYNRGVEKRIIFTDNQDYNVFLNYLRDYLSPPPDLQQLKQDFTLKGYTFKGVPKQIKNFHQQIDLLCYCLMPNHFHFLVHQKDKYDIKKFTQSLLTRYSIYFNTRHSRTGRLFQGTYKGALITNDYHLLHLSRYIHLNPSAHSPQLELTYSSYKDYIGKTQTPWVYTKTINSYFDQPTIPFLNKKITYQTFVEDYDPPTHTQKQIQKFTLED